MRVLLWINTLDNNNNFVSAESDPESNKTLTLKLFMFFSVTYAGKTYRNGPRRFDLESEFKLPSVGILFSGGDCFLLSELPFCLSIYVKGYSIFVYNHWYDI